MGIQIFSVHPGNTVDSKINIEFLLIYFPTILQALFTSLRSGELFLLTGVGTVTIKILQSFSLSS